MKFGVLRDIKNGEFRVIATPTEVIAFTAEDSHRFGSPNCIAAFPQYHK